MNTLELRHCSCCDFPTECSWIPNHNYEHAPEQEGVTGWWMCAICGNSPIGNALIYARRPAHYERYEILRGVAWVGNLLFKALERTAIMGRPSTPHALFEVLERNAEEAKQERDGDEEEL